MGSPLQISSQNYTLTVSSLGDVESIVEVDSHPTRIVETSPSVQTTVSTTPSESVSESSLTSEPTSPSKSPSKSPSIVVEEEKPFDTTDLNPVNARRFPPYPSDAKPLLVFATTVMDSNVNDSSLHNL